MNAVPPVFVGGCARSGTTLLIDLIGLHPEISPIYETGFLYDLAGILWHGGSDAETRVRRATAALDAWSQPLPHRPHEKHAGERYAHGPHHILFDRADVQDAWRDAVRGLQTGTAMDVAVREMTLRLFAAHCAADGKPLWATKLPNFCRLLDWIDRVFPGAIFVNCLRAPEAAVRSVLGRSWGAGDVGAAVDFWASAVLAVEAARPQWGDRILDVRYERLTADPTAVLAEVFARIGVADRSADALAAHAARGLRLAPPPSSAAQDDVIAEAVAARAGAAMRASGYSAG